MGGSSNRKTRILALGFDRIGCTDVSAVEGHEFTIHHVPYDSEESLVSADALMLPSDIFEIQRTHTHPLYGNTYTTYHCETKKLAEREKQLCRVLEKNGWVCLMLRRLNNGDTRKSQQDDLARKLANSVFAWTKAHDPYPHLKSKNDEFRKFFDEYGIAQTELGIPHRAVGMRVLATSPTGNETYAAEVGGKRFFLPLKPLSRVGELADILKCAAESILSYKRRNDLYLPQWVEDIRFKQEDEASTKIKQHADEIERLKLDLSKWPRYKAILTASGRQLSEVMVSVLREYFLLNLKSEEAYIEDAMIYSDTSEPLYVVEIKGVASGIKREQINQLDSHRERLGLDQQLPGLLIINDFAETPGIEARKAKQIDSQHLEHARRLNVRILRTVTLMEMMIETEDSANRAEMFLKACDQASPLVTLPIQD